MTDFVHLHTHSDASALDGHATVTEIVSKVVSDDQPAVAITDHGSNANHPPLKREAEKAGIKPIFGIEAYLVDNRHIKERETSHDYWHLIMWAKTDQGLRNLWAMSTESHLSGFYYYPKMDFEVLEKYREGVMASTGCLRGPVASAILADDEDRARIYLGKLLSIFGDDLFVEIQTNRGYDQEKVNKELLVLAHEYSIPVIAASDAHYVNPEDKLVHAAWLQVQTGDSDWFGNPDTSYHLMTGSEIAEELSYLPEPLVAEAMQNTLLVADRAQATLRKIASMPVYSKGENPEDKDFERLLGLCMDNWGKIQGKAIPEAVYEQRLMKEMSLIRNKGFSGYFLMVSNYCRWAKQNGIMVGPGRGSGAASLVAFLTGITGVDPVESDLMFERFLTEGRSALPDFDVDFPASKRHEITEYIVNKYGQDNVIRVGTQIKIKNKGVIRDIFRIKKEEWGMDYRDIDAISKLIDEAEADTAGKGLPWDELMAHLEDEFKVYDERYPELFPLAERLVNRIKTYGKHAAGLVISPETRLTDSLPLRSADDDVVSEFDMESLEELGLVKFDILTLSTLDKIQIAVDLIKEETGITIDFDTWRDEFNDAHVWDEISAGHTLGIFQIETPGSTRDVKELQPRSLNELADVISLVRPGPKRSGLTEIYLRRKRGEESVTYADPRLESILAPTQGVMVYQEQILRICMELAGYDETEADDVRKILGKKKTELVGPAGEKFVERAVANNTDRDLAKLLWSQMAEFALYSFNRTHAFSYATLAYYTAWLKFNWPGQFLTASLTTTEKDRIPEFVREARRMGFRVMPPDVNLSGSGFSYDGDTIRYGFDGIKGIGAAAVRAVTEGQPYTSIQDFMERKGKAANLKTVKIMAAAGAFDSLHTRKQAEHYLDWLENYSDKCAFWDPGHSNDLVPHLPCHFDWLTELTFKENGKHNRLKAPPKRCTKACRNFTPREYEPIEGEYTPAEIQRRELELLGLHLSSTPFDLVEDWWGQEVIEGLQLLKGSDIAEAPEGDYLVAALVSRVRPYTAKNGKAMGFIGLMAMDAELDVVVFSDQWERFKPELKSKDLLFALVRKNYRGLTLTHIQRAL